MGPRPTRPRQPVTSSTPRPAPVVVVTASRQAAPVGAPSPRRTPGVPTVPLPADHRATLSAIAKALRNVPREAIYGPPELFVWLNRQAKALERARDTPMHVAPSTPRPGGPTSALSSPPRALSARERAEPVFGGATAPTSAPPSPLTVAKAIFRPNGGALPRSRIVMDRKDRRVRVEVRTARACGDLFEGPYAYGDPIFARLIID